MKRSNFDLGLLYLNIKTPRSNPLVEALVVSETPT